MVLVYEKLLSSIFNLSNSFFITILFVALINGLIATSQPNNGHWIVPIRFGACLADLDQACQDRAFKLATCYCPPAYSFHCRVAASRVGLLATFHWAKEDTKHLRQS